MKIQQFKLGLVASITLSISLASCNKIPHVDATKNDIDNLSIAHTNLNGETQLYAYDYVCTSDTNQLSIGGPLFSGSANVRILNSLDSIIFEKQVTSVTAVDQPIWSESGIWTVEVDFQAASGTFALDLEQ